VTVQLRKNKKTVSSQHHPILNTLLHAIQKSYKTDDDLRVFCYDGYVERSWTRIWSTLEFVVISEVEEFQLDVGENATTLTERYTNSWSWSSLTDLAGITKQSTNYQKRTTIAPYEITCIGVSYHGSDTVNYSVVLTETGTVMYSDVRYMCIVCYCSNQLPVPITTDYWRGVVIDLLSDIKVNLYLYLLWGGHTTHVALTFTTILMF